MPRRIPLVVARCAANPLKNRGHCVVAKDPDPNQIWDQLAKHFAMKRSGGHIGFDLLITVLAYFLAGKVGGIKGFCRHAKLFVLRIEALAGLKLLASRSASSRLFAATDRLPDSDESISWLLAQGSGCGELLRCPLGQARDARGALFQARVQLEAEQDTCPVAMLTARGQAAGKKTAKGFAVGPAADIGTLCAATTGWMLWGGEFPSVTLGREAC